VLSVLQDGEVLDSAVAVQEWLDNVEESCKFPGGVCWLPLDNRFPAQLITPPAAYPWVCAWAVWVGHAASVPICVHVEEETTETTRVRFTHGTESVFRVGRDELTGAVMLASPTHLSHDLTIEAAAGYPLQVKYSGVGATPAVLAEAAQGGGVAELFSGHFAYESQWNTVSHWDPPFTVRSLSQSDASSSEHTLIQVSTRLLVDINTWSQQSPKSFLALTGRMPSVTVGDVDALTLSVQTSSNGRILFRWSKISVGELRAVDGGQIWRVVSGAANVLRAYSMEVGVRTRLLVKETRPGICSANLSEEGVPLVQEDRTIGPRLCQGGSSLQLRKPPGQGWLLWAVAFAPGLALSTPVEVRVTANCYNNSGFVLMEW